MKRKINKNVLLVAGALAMTSALPSTSVLANDVVPEDAYVPTTTLPALPGISDGTLIVDRSEYLKPVPVELFSGGYGTFDSPYQISTKEDIILLGQYTSGNMAIPGGVTPEYLLEAEYEQTSNIDLEYDSNFVPIGYGSDVEFSGVYNGNNHTISNLAFRGANDLERISKVNAVGLFSNTYNAEINNLIIEDPLIQSTYDATGSLVGVARDTKINNCHVVTTDENAGVYSLGDNTGGLVGLSEGNTYIIDSSVKTTVQGVDGVGGLVGAYFGNEGSLNVSRSHFIGDVIGENGVGGIFGGNGLQTLLNIDKSYSGGTITGSSQVGGIVGSLKPVSSSKGTSYITNNYSYSDIQGHDKVGGIAGYIYNIGNSSTRVYVLNNYSATDIKSTGTNLGGLIGYLNDTENSSVTVQDNISFTDFDAPNSDYIGSIIGNANVVNSVIENNYVSYAQVLSDSAGNNDYATVVYANDLVSPTWWETTLDINDENSYILNELDKGYLPKLNTFSSSQFSYEQPDLAFAGNLVPEVDSITYEKHSVEHGVSTRREFDSNLVSVQLKTDNGYIDLTEGVEYELTDETIVYYSDFLESLPLGEATITFTYDNGHVVDALIYVIDGVGLQQVIISGDSVHLGQYEFLDAVYKLDTSYVTNGLDVVQITDTQSGIVLDPANWEYRNYGEYAVITISEDHFIDNNIQPEGKFKFLIEYNNGTTNEAFIYYHYSSGGGNGNGNGNGNGHQNGNGNGHGNSNGNGHDKD